MLFIYDEMERCNRLCQQWRSGAERKVVKTESEWKAQLSPEQFRVARKKVQKWPLRERIATRMRPEISLHLL
jgi:hypothetical protein